MEHFTHLVVVFSDLYCEKMGSPGHSYAYLLIICSSHLSLHYECVLKHLDVSLFTRESCFNIINSLIFCLVTLWSTDDFVFLSSPDPLVLCCIQCRRLKHLHQKLKCNIEPWSS